MTEYDIEIQISADAGDALTSSMPNWKNVREKITKSPKFSTDNILNIAHTTTKDRLEAAKMYLSILKAGYKAQPILSVSFIIRSMADNIFFSLASALDALSFEINQVYTRLNLIPSLDHTMTPANTQLLFQTILKIER
jgi:hypothetical protein